MTVAENQAIPRTNTQEKNCLNSQGINNDVTTVISRHQQWCTLCRYHSCTLSTNSPLHTNSSPCCKAIKIAMTFMSSDAVFTAAYNHIGNDCKNRVKYPQSNTWTIFGHAIMVHLRTRWSAYHTQLQHTPAVDWYSELPMMFFSTAFPTVHREPVLSVKLLKSSVSTSATWLLLAGCKSAIMKVRRRGRCCFAS